MILKKIIAKNVYSFDNIEVDLNSEKVVQVTGKNLDENRVEESVNGIGKTNLYNIIAQCLYSRDIAKTTKGFLGNMFSDGNFYIELWVDDLVVIYSKSECKIYKDEKVLINGRKAVTDYFEERIPFDLFLPLTYISSSIYFPFFDATPKQQKEFISVVFADLLRLKEAIPVLKEELGSTVKEIADLNAKIEVYEKLLEEEIETIDFVIPELPELQNFDLEMKELLRKIRENERLELRKQELEALKCPEEITNKEDELVIVRDRISKGNTHIEILEKEIAKLEKLKSISICPTCGQEVKYDEELVKEKYETLKKYKNVKLQLLTELEVLQVHQRAYKEYEKKLAVYNKSQNELASIHVIDSKPLQERLDELCELDNAQKELWLNTKIERERLLEKRAAIEDRQVRYNRAKVEYAQMQELLKEKKDLKNELDILIEICNKVIIEKQIPERLAILEKFINIDLSNFTSQYKIKLEMNDTKISPKVIKLGKEYPYKNCSQGERGRINLALLFAIRSILSTLGKELPNLLFIDELLNIIDTGGKEVIVETLKSMDTNSFIVCHDYEFDIPQLELIKKGNKTNVRGI